MTTLAVEIEIPSADNLIVTGDAFSVARSDGRTISIQMVDGVPYPPSRTTVNSWLLY